MTPVAYEVFLPHVLPYVQHCLDDQAVIAIRHACMDFCRDTFMVQQDMTPISTVANTSTYTVPAPTGYTVSQVMSLYYLNKKLERRSQMELERAYSRNWQSLLGTPQVYTQFTQDAVTVALVPDAAVTDALTGRIAVQPTRASTQVDGVLFERYLDEIAAGAISRLLATPDQPYTDLQRAAAYSGSFRAGVSAARAFVNGGMNHAPMRVRFQRIW